MTAAGARLAESTSETSLTSFVRPVVHASMGESVASAARRMRDQRIGCLVVTRENRPIGILTDRDLTVRVVAEGKDPNTVHVDDVLTYDPFTLVDTDSLDSALRCMKEHGVRRVPIVNGDGLLTGIITADDLMVALGHQLSFVADAIAEPADADDSR